MAAIRRALALNAVAAASLQSRTSIARSRLLSVPANQFRAHVSTSSRRQYAFHTQLENADASSILESSGLPPAAPAIPQTLTEKIVQKHAEVAAGKVVKQGDYVTLRPHKSMSHDNSWPIISKLVNGMGITSVNDSSQIVFALDHDVQSKTESNLKKYALIEEFAKKNGIYFSGAGRGISHQIMAEEGWAWPGTLCVASDSHSNHYGGVGCLGTAIVRTDAASVLATSKTWWQVPPVAKITLTGILPHGVTGKDVIVALCGLFNSDEVLNHAIEFTGTEQTLSSIPVDDRISIANMTTEWGGLSGLWPVDDTLIAWYRAKASSASIVDSPVKERINHERINELLQNRLVADPGAEYAKELYLNLSTLSPFVSGPNSVKVANPLTTIESQNIAINRAYLVSCTNSRSSDIKNAATVFREAAKDGTPAKIHPGVKFYMAAASMAEQKIAEESGDWQVLLDAGAQPLPPGCAQCIGLGTGLLEEGEVGISASNRNYKGRMGSALAKTYLSSPQVVAASALEGKIVGPNWYQKPEGVEKVIIGEGSGDHVADKARSIEDGFDKFLSEVDDLIAAAEGASGQPAEQSPEDETETLTDILPGFPEKIEGEIVFCKDDNINTDGIYPGKYTYQDGMTREDMARVCMENYDTEFGKIVKPGDILVAGRNFGTGSSREQAATSILAKNIPLVVAASFGNIFSRNSINNALMGVEVPRLVERLRETYKDEENSPLTRRTGWKLLWDVGRSKVVITEADGSTWEQKVGEVPPNVQEIAMHGLEAWVKSKFQAQQ